MRILVAHNRYALRGGEDAVFEQETDLLERKGHEVRRWEVTNQGLESEGRFHAAAQCIWSRCKRELMAEIVRTWRPDIVHIHNFVARFSPSIHRVADREGVAVVQTFHNFRLLCPGGLLLRGGQYCDLCRRKWFKWPGVLYACYRRSRMASMTIACMLAVHRMARTWECVHAYIVMTNAAKGEFVRGGLPQHRLHVKPNFVPDLAVQGSGNAAERRGFAFVGRLSDEKGVMLLLEAWRQVETEESLTVIGDGPLMPIVRRVAGNDRRIRIEGWLPRETVYGNLNGRRAVVVPSQCSEMFPLTVAEAYAMGTPVIASRTPTLAELVVEGETGLLTDLGSAKGLANAMTCILENGDLGVRMGLEARRTYEAKYVPERNYVLLMQIYEAAIAERRSALAVVS